MGRKKTQPNRHHIRPRSRFPNGTNKDEKDKDNVVELDRDWHDAWHYMYGNATPAEVCKAINIIMQPDTRWTYGAIKRLLEELRYT